MIGIVPCYPVAIRQNPPAWARLGLIELYLQRFATHLLAALATQEAVVPVSMGQFEDFLCAEVRRGPPADIVLSVANEREW